MLRVCDPCIYPIRVPPLQKPLLCPEPMLMAIEKTASLRKKYLTFCLTTAKIYIRPNLSFALSFSRFLRKQTLYFVCVRVSERI